MQNFTDVIVALIGMSGVIGASYVTTRRQARKVTQAVNERTAEIHTTVTNGLRTVVESIHTDMQLMVLPTLIELKAWKDSFDGTPWSDKNSMEDFVSRFGDTSTALKAVRDDLARVQAEIQEHVDWEESHKYSALENRLLIMESLVQHHHENDTTEQHGM